LLPLNDLYVFGKQSLGFWKQVFLSAKQILLEFKDYKQPDLDLCVYDDMYLTKTLERLESFKDCIEFDKYLDMTQMAQASAKYICKTTPEHIGVMHGDFCFSNILNDSRTQSLKLIDPRGIDANRNFTIYGDTRYDLAKFFHSVVGCYDLIIAGKFHFVDDFSSIEFFSSHELEDIERLFDEVFFHDSPISKKEIIAINVHLFLSMLPLHADRPDRQKAMIANAYRLYKKLQSE
jgi:hypothetical protein